MDFDGVDGNDETVVGVNDAVHGVENGFDVIVDIAEVARCGVEIAANVDADKHGSDDGKSAHGFFSGDSDSALISRYGERFVDDAVAIDARSWLRAWRHVDAEFDDHAGASQKGMSRSST